MSRFKIMHKRIEKSKSSKATKKKIENERSVGPKKPLDNLSNSSRIMARLDSSLPLASDEWVRVEQMLNRFSEFVPESMIVELVSSLASYADDQALNAYLIGYGDAVGELGNLQEKSGNRAA